MFILGSHEMKSSMFAKDHKGDADIELWHKRIGHINLQKLKGMQSTPSVDDFRVRVMMII